MIKILHGILILKDLLVNINRGELAVVEAPLEGVKLGGGVQQLRCESLALLPQVPLLPLQFFNFTQICKVQAVSDLSIRI